MIFLTQMRRIGSGGRQWHADRPKTPFPPIGHRHHGIARFNRWFPLRQRTAQVSVRKVEAATAPSMAARTEICRAPKKDTLASCALFCDTRKPD
jgi:hypothetical protein